MRIGRRSVSLGLASTLALTIAAPGSEAASAAEIDVGVAETLGRFYRQVDAGRELVGRAAAL
ncbi:MAG: hypothetical protein M3N38_06335, partial [Pseudomonadota bacterium]|nr:hypothetical protein [Pseudomonadota bacterium]